MLVVVGCQCVEEVGCAVGTHSVLEKVLDVARDEEHEVDEQGVGPVPDGVGVLDVEVEMVAGVKGMVVLIAATMNPIGGQQSWGLQDDAVVAAVLV